MAGIRGLIQTANDRLWRVRRRELPPVRSFLVRQARVAVLAAREFSKDRCILHAAALTFYTVLSIVPLVAMAFGIAKGFGLDKVLEQTIRKSLEGQGEAIDRIIAFSENLLANTRGGVVAGIGVALLLWTIIKVLGTIEQSFNDIWGVKQPRTLSRKFSDYLAFMVIAPLFLIISSSVTVVVTSQVTAIVQRLELWGWLGAAVFVLLKILPVSLLWMVFTFTYLSLPNTKVGFSSALLGGVIAGTLYQVVQWVYISFQVGVSQYGAIYGSFAALPLFLVWVQLSWQLVLLGAEISFAHEYVDLYEFAPDCERVSPALARLAALAATQVCVKRFDQGQPPPSAAELARHLDAPLRLVDTVLRELVESRVLSEVRSGPKGETGYQPARNIEEMTVGSVLQQLAERGVHQIPLAASPEVQTLARALDTFRELELRSEANRRLKDL